MPSIRFNCGEFVPGGQEITIPGLQPPNPPIIVGKPKPGDPPWIPRRPKPKPQDPRRPGGGRPPGPGNPGNPGQKWKCLEYSVLCPDGITLRQVKRKCIPCSPIIPPGGILVSWPADCVYATRPICEISCVESIEFPCPSVSGPGTGGPQTPGGPSTGSAERYKCNDVVFYCPDGTVRITKRFCVVCTQLHINGVLTWPQGCTFPNKPACEVACNDSPENPCITVSQGGGSSTGGGTTGGTGTRYLCNSVEFFCPDGTTLKEIRKFCVACTQVVAEPGALPTWPPGCIYLTKPQCEIVCLDELNLNSCISQVLSLLKSLKSLRNPKFLASQSSIRAMDNSLSNLRTQLLRGQPLFSNHNNLRIQRLWLSTSTRLLDHFQVLKPLVVLTIHSCMTLLETSL